MRLLEGKGKAKTASEAVADGEAPSVAEAERTAQRIKRAARTQSRSAMVEAAPAPSEESDRVTVQKASARKLAKAKTEGTAAVEESSA